VAVPLEAWAISPQVAWQALLNCSANQTTHTATSKKLCFAWWAMAARVRPLIVLPLVSCWEVMSRIIQNTAQLLSRIFQFAAHNFSYSREPWPVTFEALPALLPSIQQHHQGPGTTVQGLGLYKGNNLLLLNQPALHFGL
jgi:hypothetical protein